MFDGGPSPTGGLQDRQATARVLLLLCRRSGRPNSDHPRTLDCQMMDDPILTRRRFLHHLGGGLAAASVGTLPLVRPRAAFAAGLSGVPRQKLGWAIVGLGSYATRQILPRMHECEFSEPVALVSGSPDKARTLADEYGIAHSNIYNYDNYDTIADNDEIDIVYDPCAGIRVQAAPDTTEAELVAIDRAIEMWTQVADFHIARNPTRPFEQVLPIYFEEASLVFRGVYQDEIGDVVINRRLVDPDEQAITIAHELGHAIGLFHIETRDSVMNSGNLVLLPLTTDVDALSELWGPCVHDNRDLAQPQQLQLKTPSLL